MKTNDWLILGALAIGGYMLYKKTIQPITQPLNTASQFGTSVLTNTTNTASWIYDTLNSMLQPQKITNLTSPTYERFPNLYGQIVQPSPLDVIKNQINSFTSGIFGVRML